MGFLLKPFPDCDSFIRDRLAKETYLKKKATFHPISEVSNHMGHFAILIEPYFLLNLFEITDEIYFLVFSPFPQ